MSSSSKYTLLRMALCLQILLLIAGCNGYHHDDQPGENAKRYCGPKLTSVMRYICGGAYSSRQPISNGKRSGADIDELSDYINDDALSFPRSYTRFAYQLHPLVTEFDSALPTRARGDWLSVGKRGIVEECCARGCKLTDLMQYCQR